MTALSCSGFSATTSCAVEQFGLAMMFFLTKPETASALTSGTISGTSGSIRHADELSITTAPAAALFGAHSLPPRPARRHQADIDVAEIVMLERFDLQGTVAIGHFDAHAAARRQRHHLVSREFAFVENVEHSPPDIAGRSDHRDFITHRSLSEEKCLARASCGKRRGSASMRETRLR